MEVLDIEDGYAILEDGSGYYGVHFIYEDSRGMLNLEEVVFSFSLENLEYGGGSHDDRRLPQIEEAILAYFGQGTLESADRYGDLYLICQAPNSYKLEISSDGIVDGAESIRLLFGELRYLRHFIKPLNKLIKLYLQSSGKIDRQVVLRLVSRTIEDIYLMFGLSLIDVDLTLDTVNQINSSKLEAAYAKCKIQSGVASSTSALLNSLVKEATVDGLELDWLVIKDRQRTSFDISAFKIDHPELYSKYQKTHDSLHLTSLKSNKFPLSESELRKCLADSFDVHGVR